MHTSTVELHNVTLAVVRTGSPLHRRSRPYAQAAANETPDPECRSVCATAAATVKRVAEAAAAARAAETDERKVRVAAADLWRPPASDLPLRFRLTPAGSLRGSPLAKVLLGALC